jgi:hypothetical protein
VVGTEQAKQSHKKRKKVLGKVVIALLKSIKERRSSTLSSEKLIAAAVASALTAAASVGYVSLDARVDDQGAQITQNSDYAKELDSIILSLEESAFTLGESLATMGGDLQNLGREFDIGANTLVTISSRLESLAAQIAAIDPEVANLALWNAGVAQGLAQQALDAANVAISDANRPPVVTPTQLAELGLQITKVSNDATQAITAQQGATQVAQESAQAAQATADNAVAAASAAQQSADAAQQSADAAQQSAYGTAESAQQSSDDTAANIAELNDVAYSAQTAANSAQVVANQALLAAAAANQVAASAVAMSDTAVSVTSYAKSFPPNTKAVNIGPIASPSNYEEDGQLVINNPSPYSQPYIVTTIYTHVGSTGFARYHSVVESTSHEDFSQVSNSSIPYVENQFSELVVEWFPPGDTTLTFKGQCTAPDLTYKCTIAISVTAHVINEAELVVPSP